MLQENLFYQIIQKLYEGLYLQSKPLKTLNLKYYYQSIYLKMSFLNEKKSNQKSLSASFFEFLKIFLEFL